MEFCASCSALGVHLKSFLSHPGTDDNPRLKDPIRRIGYLNEIRARVRYCALCRLIYAVFRSGLSKRVTTITDVSTIAIFAKWINALGPERNSRLRSPTTCIIVWAVSADLPDGRYKVLLRAVSDALPTQPYFGCIYPNSASFLDHERLKRWLEHCENHHASCKQSSSGLPTRYFYVVDTRLRCLVEPTVPCRYLALSYVWGGVSQFTLNEDNLDRLKIQDGIRVGDLSATIRDAIVLTSMIGERYLWVDTLCVVQDSETTRPRTLADMDRIYAQSLLTIVAGSCSNANESLPGVSVARTWKQWYQKLSRSLTISAHIDYADALEDATYSTRAWTFQEHQLANRLLVFAPNGQIYFSCNSAVYSEDIIDGPALEVEPATLYGARRMKLQPDPERPWSIYCRAAEIYSSRILSHQRDALDAFSGILRTLHSGRCVEAVPVTFLDLALLWQPFERLRRREGFSSWSWVGWIGRIRYNTEKIEERNKSEVQALSAWFIARTWIVWHVSTRKKCHLPAYRIWGPLWSHRVRPENATQNSRFPKQHDTITPTPGMLFEQLKRIPLDESRDIHYLQFWTMSVHCRINVDPSAVLRYSSPNAENMGNGLRRFKVLHDDTQTHGWVMLDQEWIGVVAEDDVKTQEFILLSEAAGIEGNDKSIANGAITESCGAFNAMMIVWTQGIAQRAGIGRISADLGRKGEWKEIILG